MSRPFARKDATGKEERRMEIGMERLRIVILCYHSKVCSFPLSAVVNKVVHALKR